MARLARVVPHHVTQRGNRWQETFFSEDDYHAYLAVLGRAPDWRAFLAGGSDADEMALWRRHERTGRPLGEADFLGRIETTVELSRDSRRC